MLDRAIAVCLLRRLVLDEFPHAESVCVEFGETPELERPFLRVSFWEDGCHYGGSFATAKDELLQEQDEDWLWHSLRDLLDYLHARHWVDRVGVPEKDEPQEDQS